MDGGGFLNRSNVMKDRSLTPAKGKAKWDHKNTKMNKFLWVFFVGSALWEQKLPEMVQIFF